MGPYGVIGAGSFGTAIADLISENGDVIIFSRRQDQVNAINNDHRHLGVQLKSNVKATSDIREITDHCKLIFPIVPSEHFRAMMRQVGKNLKPDHILIHGTKGFDILRLDNDQNRSLRAEDVHTMSDVMLQESVTLRVGCLSGPNLSSEILEGQPAATVIASHFTEVIETGKKALRSSRFQVYGSYSMRGAELAGALKNLIAIGAGIIAGKGLGHNTRALLISRGLIEMIYLGKALGGDARPFLGTAGIGDLVATAASDKSRNYTFGYRLARGETFSHIQENMEELAEGVRTLKMAMEISETYRLQAPITKMLNRVVFNNFDIDKAIRMLIEYPYDVDVDFI